MTTATSPGVLLFDGFATAESAFLNHMGIEGLRHYRLVCYRHLAWMLNGVAEVQWGPYTWTTAEEFEDDTVTCSAEIYGVGRGVTSIFRRDDLVVICLDRSAYGEDPILAVFDAAREVRE